MTARAKAKGTTRTISLAMTRAIRANTKGMTRARHTARINAIANSNQLRATISRRTTKAQAQLAMGQTKPPGNRCK